MHSCSLYWCPWTVGSAEWIRQWVKYLIELRRHRTISMNQATVNQGFALPVVFQLSIHFDLRIPVCDHLIFHEMMSCEHGERSKRHNQMRKIYGIQARQTGTAQTTERPFVSVDVTKLLPYWMLPPVTLWAARAWDSWWRQSWECVLQNSTRQPSSGACLWDSTLSDTRISKQFSSKAWKVKLFLCRMILNHL